MKFRLTIILILLIASSAIGQSKKQIEVLTLGSFHFDFPNLDVIKTGTDDKIDVLDPKYQKEIASVDWNIWISKDQEQPKVKPRLLQELLSLALRLCRS